MVADLRLTLEYLGYRGDYPWFRLTFDEARDRYLLHHPEICGLKFKSVESGESIEWLTGYLLAGALRNEFMLIPDSRISFDFEAVINRESSPENWWGIELPPGDYGVHFEYELATWQQRYDHIGKGSRQADATHPWTGCISSNKVQMQVLDQSGCT